MASLGAAEHDLAHHPAGHGARWSTAGWTVPDLAEVVATTRPVSAGPWDLAWYGPSPPCAYRHPPPHRPPERPAGQAQLLPDRRQPRCKPAPAAPLEADGDHARPRHRSPGTRVLPADDYYEVLARLRAEAPIFEFARASKTVARHEDIREISRDPAGSSARPQGARERPTPGGSAVEGSIIPWTRPPTATGGGAQPGVHRPGPGAMEPRVRELTAELLDTLPAGEEVGAVDALTAPLPVLVICRLLGIPAADRSAFRRWSDATIVASDGRSAPERGRHRRAGGDVHLPGSLGRRSWPTRRRPSLAARARAEIEGRRRTAGESCSPSSCRSWWRAGPTTTSPERLAHRAARPPDRSGASTPTPERIPGAVEGSALDHPDPAVRPHRHCRHRGGRHPGRRGDYLRDASTPRAAATGGVMAPPPASSASPRAHHAQPGLLGLASTSASAPPSPVRRRVLFESRRRTHLHPDRQGHPICRAARSGLPSRSPSG